MLARVEWVQGPAAMESGNLGNGGEGVLASLAVSQWRRGEQHAPTAQVYTEGLAEPNTATLSTRAISMCSPKSCIVMCKRHRDSTLGYADTSTTVAIDNSSLAHDTVEPVHGSTTCYY